MPPDFAPMLVAIVLILTVGFITVIRPIAKPLVRLFEAMITEREQLPPRELADIHQALEQIEGRLQLMEERQSFYEALRTGPDVAQLAPATQSRAPEFSDEQAGPRRVD